MEKEKIIEENRDLWYKRMGNRPSMKPEDEPFSWMEYFDIMDEYKTNKS